MYINTNTLLWFTWGNTDQVTEPETLRTSSWYETLISKYIHSSRKYWAAVSETDVHRASQVLVLFLMLTSQSGFRRIINHSTLDLGVQEFIKILQLRVYYIPDFPYVVFVKWKLSLYWNTTCGKSKLVPKVKPLQIWTAFAIGNFSFMFTVIFLLVTSPIGPRSALQCHSQCV